MTLDLTTPHVCRGEALCLSIQTTGFVGGKSGRGKVFIVSAFLVQAPTGLSTSMWDWGTTRHVRRQRSFSWCLYLPSCKLMLHSPREEANKVHLELNWGGKGKKIVDCLFLTFFCCSGSSWADYGAVEQWDGSSLEETPRRDVRDYDCCFYFYLWLVKGKVKFYILTFSDQLMLNLFFLF